MSFKLLTRDNPPLSRPKFSASNVVGTPVGTGVYPPIDHDQTGGQVSEIDFTQELPEGVAAFVQQGLSENTKKAYLGDIEHFLEWGGKLPATDLLVASYLSDFARVLSAHTLSRRLASIAKAHRSRGLHNPTDSELVKATMRGIRRALGVAQRQAKPLLRDDLFNILESMGGRQIDIRDAAVLLIGFAGGFRRSELVGLNVGDLDFVQQGVIITLRHSKTDQERAGRRIGIPFGRTKWCPVRALKTWLVVAKIAEGPVFLVMDRHSRLKQKRLSGEAVSIVVKNRLRKIRIESNHYSGHSLRAGFATSAAMAGASLLKIRQQTGHTSDAMLTRYIRDGELFINNAAGSLL